jgi:hypothetical protein
MVIYIALRLRNEHTSRWWWFLVLPSQDGYGAAMPRLGSGIVKPCEGGFYFSFRTFCAAQYMGESGKFTMSARK